MEDGIIILNEEQLNQLESLASLKFTISEIELMFHIPPGALRRSIANEESLEHQRYIAGKLISQLTYRQSVQKAANNGEDWAIKIMEDWGMKQNEEDMM